jgi:hypothetical protein
MWPGAGVAGEESEVSVLAHLCHHLVVALHESLALPGHLFTTCEMKDCTSGFPGPWVVASAMVT